MLDRVLSELGPHKDWFYYDIANAARRRKVALKPEFIDNYYNLIQHPVWLKDVESRLDRGGYHSQEEFHSVSAPRAAG